MQEKFPLGGLHFESRSYQTSTLVNDKIYVIEGLDDEANSSLGIQIFDKLSSKWESPVVLGIRPSFCKCHSTLLVNKDRILIIKRESAPDDCIWLLEEKAEAELRKMRQTLGFKAKPMPDFNREIPSTPTKIKKLPLTQPRSPKFGRRPNSSTGLEKKSLPPKSPCPSVKSDSFRHAMDKRSRPQVIQPLHSLRRMPMRMFPQISRVNG